MTHDESSITPETVRAVAKLLREVANEADVDIRTTIARAAGDEIRTRSGARVDRALAKRVGT